MNIFRPSQLPPVRAERRASVGLQGQAYHLVGPSTVVRRSSQWNPGDGKRLAYVPALRGMATIGISSTKVWFFDTNHAFIRSAAVSAAGAIVYVPSIARVMVAESDTANIDVIDPKTGAISTTIVPGTSITPGAVPYLCWIPSANEVLYDNNDAAIDRLIDVPTLAYVGASGYGWTVGPHVYLRSTREVVGAQGNGLDFIDPIGRALNATVAGMGSASLGIAHDPTTNRIFVCQPGANVLNVIDAATRTILTTALATMAGPKGLLGCPANGLLYIAHDGGKAVTAIRPLDYSHVQTIALPIGVDSLGYNPSNRCIYAQSSDGTRLFAISIDDHTKVADILLV